MRQRMCAGVLVIALAAVPAVGLSQVELPGGEARAFVEGACVACHRLDFIPDSRGSTHEGWEELVSAMMTLPAEQADSVAGCPAEHFPTQPGTEPALIEGPVNVRISEWIAPTLGSRPHDPLYAHDRSIWWTGQFANRLGRLDPATGEMREFPLETASSGPHGLVEDGSGNI